MMVSQRLGVFPEHRALERIELVTNENGDGQASLRGFELSQNSRLIDVDASVIVEL